MRKYHQEFIPLNLTADHAMRNYHSLLNSLCNLLDAYGCDTVAKAQCPARIAAEKAVSKAMGGI